MYSARDGGLRLRLRGGRRVLIRSPRKEDAKLLDAVAGACAPPTVEDLVAACREAAPTGPAEPPQRLLLTDDASDGGSRRGRRRRGRLPRLPRGALAAARRVLRRRGPRPRVPALFACHVRRADRAPLGPVPDVPRAVRAAAGHAAAGLRGPGLGLDALRRGRRRAPARRARRSRRSSRSTARPSKSICPGTRGAATSSTRQACDVRTGLKAALLGPSSCSSSENPFYGIYCVTTTQITGS